MRRCVRRGWGLAAWGALMLGGCAAGARGPAVPSPSEIPALEARLAGAPTDGEARLRLGLAYRAAGRPADAERVLAPPAPSTGDGGAVTLAAAYEDLGRYAEARSVYERLAASAPDARLRREAARKLLAIERAELRVAALEAVGREAELRGTPPAPEVVGVFPFLFGSNNPDLSPLSRALAELLTVDLSQTDRLRVVERTRVQFLLDELALAESGRVDPATAARSGRLLGAGRVVQGRIDGEGQALRLQALPVRVGAEPVQEPGAPILQEGQVQQLFDMEKALALELYASMGIQLTAAETERVTRRRTQNVQALLAFGYGLEAADAGRLEEASDWFGRARELDPGFDLAAEWEERIAAEREWGEADPDRLYRVAVGLEDFEWDVLRERYSPVDALIVSPEGRDAVSEALGVEGLDRRGVLEIIIRGPGDEQ